MVPTKFSIELLDNPDAAPYWPGQEVSILVHVNLNRECVTTGIKVTYCGKARVHFGKGRPGGRTIEHYAAEENYLHAEAYVYGTGNSDVVLTRGEHQIPFHFSLPEGLPSTHEGTDCKVSYKIIAEVEGSWWKLQGQKVKMHFKVRGILDLNLHPTASQAIEVRNESDTCCVWGKGGPILFCMRLPRSGYVPGEFISGIVVVHNQSNSRVKGVKATLIQKRTYISRGKPKSLNTDICYATTPSVASGETKVWNENILYIPQLPPTSIASNGIIEIQYMIKVVVEMSGTTSNLKYILRPIIIGTIPMTKVPPLFEKIQTETAIISTNSSLIPLTTKSETSLVGILKGDKSSAVPVTDKGATAATGLIEIPKVDAIIIAKIPKSDKNLVGILKTDKILAPSPSPNSAPATNGLRPIPKVETIIIASVPKTNKNGVTITEKAAKDSVPTQNAATGLAAIPKVETIILPIPKPKLDEKSLVGILKKNTNTNLAPIAKVDTGLLALGPTDANLVAISTA